VLGQESEHAQRIGAAVHQVAQRDEALAGAELELGEEPRQLVRTAVDVSDDPGRHRDPA